MRWRQDYSAVIRSGSGFCAGLAASLLLLILGYVAIQGVAALNPAFLTPVTRPGGVPGPGSAKGIGESFSLVGIPVAWGPPVGVFTGIYLALFGRGMFAET